MYFNPRSLAGATVGDTVVGNITTKFQSTLPRGSDINFEKYINAVDISIHAPSRERLIMNKKEKIKLIISIHAPSRERHIITTHLILMILFQSTLPRGSDLYLSQIQK